MEARALRFLGRGGVLVAPRRWFLPPLRAGALRSRRRWRRRRRALEAAGAGARVRRRLVRGGGGALPSPWLRRGGALPPPPWFLPTRRRGLALLRPPLRRVGVAAARRATRRRLLWFLFPARCLAPSVGPLAVGGGVGPLILGRVRWSTVRPRSGTLRLSSPRRGSWALGQRRAMPSLPWRFRFGPADVFIRLGFCLASLCSSMSHKGAHVS